MFTLSLIIPVYNEEDHIADCLQSIAAQTEMPTTVYVVDNNCSDNTIAIAKKFGFVTVLREKRQGIVFARNKGFNAASTDLLCRIDADTVLPPDWVSNIKIHYKKNNSPKKYIATGPSHFRNPTGRLFWYGLHRVTFFWLTRLVTGAQTVSCSNMFMTRELWQDIASSVCLRTDIHEDMDLAIHCTKQGVKVVFTKDFMNYMLARGILFKIHHYGAMWLRSLTIDHSVDYGNQRGHDQPSANKK